MLWMDLGNEDACRWVGMPGFGGVARGSSPFWISQGQKGYFPPLPRGGGVWGPPTFQTEVKSFTAALIICGVSHGHAFFAQNFIPRSTPQPPECLLQ